MSYHSPLSASSMERWMNCPGSFTLIKSLPGSFFSKVNASASKGTITHELASGIQYNLPSVLLEGNEIEITEEMKNAVNEYNTFLDIYINSTNCIFAARELQFKIPYINNHFSGTVDFASVVGNTLHVVDLKTGNKKVEIENNLQLQYYALGVYYWLRDRGIIGNTGGPYATPEMELLTRRTGRNRQIIKWTEITIFQTNSMGTKIRTERLPVTRIVNQFRTIMLDAMRISESDNGKLMDGPWCWFCPANKVCPLQQDKRAPKFLPWKGE